MYILGFGVFVFWGKFVKVLDVGHHCFGLSCCGVWIRLREEHIHCVRTFCVGYCTYKYNVYML